MIALAGPVRGGRAGRRWRTGRSRVGRRRIDEADVVVATLDRRRRQRLGVTHWSSRLLAARAGDLASRRWRGSGASGTCSPGGRETFKFSTDPRAGGQGPRRRRAVPEPAGEGRGALRSTRSPRSRRWTGPRRSCRCGPGLPEKATHDYVRHGTTTLFAALEVATGKVTDACYPRHRHEEFLRFLKQVAKAYPRRASCTSSCDNYATHKHPDGARPGWPSNPRITLHFTPTSGSWLNMVEIFFGIITRQAIRRGTFTSVNDLIAAIETFIDGWNERCQPFTWTKTADDDPHQGQP